MTETTELAILPPAERAAVIEHQDEISTFINSRAWVRLKR